MLDARLADWKSAFTVCSGIVVADLFHNGFPNRESMSTRSTSPCAG